MYLVNTCGANVETPDKCGRTALIWASLYGSFEVVVYLVDTCGANVETVDRYGKTALMYASVRGHSKVVEYLAPFHTTSPGFELKEFLRSSKAKREWVVPVITDYLAFEEKVINHITSKLQECRIVPLPTLSRAQKVKLVKIYWRIDEEYAQMMIKEGVPLMKDLALIVSAFVGSDTSTALTRFQKIPELLANSNPVTEVVNGIRAEVNESIRGVVDGSGDSEETE